MSLEMFLKYLISTNVYSNEAPGIILRFKFPNNYGASVINNKASYGHPKSYEIAVLYDDEIYYIISSQGDNGYRVTRKNMYRTMDTNRWGYLFLVYQV